MVGLLLFELGNITALTDDLTRPCAITPRSWNMAITAKYWTSTTRHFLLIFCSYNDPVNFSIEPDAAVSIRKNGSSVK
jgi:hypothetical protein